MIFYSEPEYFEIPCDNKVDQHRFLAAIGIDQRITGYRRNCSGADQAGVSGSAALDAEAAVQYT
jgi:predicted ABC-type transport system involved in lysophospholipase L1 biosynthesis ATPase subunit